MSIISLPENISFSTERDEDFFSRVYNNGDLSKYSKRLSAIGFEGLDLVVDAGSGFGQWAVAMAQHNKQIIGIDSEPHRVALSNRIAEHNKIDNLKFLTGKNEQISLPDNSVDAIFSYNAITLGPYRDTLSEFRRILKPGGILYFNASDLGWFIYNIIDQHNPSADFSPRDWAISTIANTIKYYANGVFVQNSALDSLLIPMEVIRDDLNNLHFEIIDINGDGKINLTNTNGVESFFADEKYNLPAVYEVLCRKAAEK